MLQTRFYYLTFVFMMNTTMKVGQIFCEIKEKLYSEFFIKEERKQKSKSMFESNIQEYTVKIKSK